MSFPPAIRIIRCVTLLAPLALNLQAQIPINPPSVDRDRPPEIGPHHRRVQTVTTLVDANGTKITETNSIIHIQAGLNVWSPIEQTWIPASDEIELLNGGGDGAIATKAQHRVLFPVNINDPQSAITVQMPDGKMIRARVMGLAITDATNPAKSLFLAETTNSIGTLVGRNQVIYENAFGGIGDIRFTVGVSSIEQDVVLREKFVPEDVGFNSATARIEIWTEIIEADAPNLTVRGRKQVVDFGSMRLGFGKAFKLSAEGEAVIEETTDVSREWTTVDGRTFIIEAVEFKKLEPFLAVLPVRTAAVDRERIDELMAKVSGDARRRPVSLAAMSPAPLPATNGTLVASVGRGTLSRKPGVVLDWTLLNVGSLTNQIFRGDETYYHGGGIINLLGSSVVFEAGVVLKWTNSASATLSVSSTTTITWLGSEYRPVILCPKDQNSWGQAVPGSTGDSGTNLYGGGIVINSDNNVISNVRIVSAHTGLTYLTHNGNPLTVRNAQFIGCRNPIIAELATLTLDNALFTSSYRMIEGDEVLVQATHLTVDACDTLVWGDAGGTDSYLYLTNSILYGLTNWGNYQFVETNQVASPTNGAVVWSAVGAGNYYLANDTYRGIGTTNVAILSEIRKRTTHPPITLINNFTASTNLFPLVPRDTNALPALGYHYDALDACWSGLIVTNATVTLTNGIAVGWYGSQGTTLKNAGKLVSEGTPLNFNRYVRYTTVQEQPYIWGTNSTTISAVTVLGPLTTAPELRLRFTDVSQLPDTLNRRRFFYLDAARCTLSMQDSWLRGAYIHLWNQSSSETMKLSLTNNLVQRSYLDMIATYVGGTYPLNLYWYNNLFQGGTNILTYGDYTADWAIKDNLFDGAVNSITEENYPDYTIPASNNGYRSSASLGGTGNKTLTVTDYQTGPLGDFYYPTSGTSNLFSLVNGGSRNATNAGLFHYTVRVDQTRETNSTVDIGYHSVATLPLNAGLVGHWKLDEAGGTLAPDSSEYGHHGTLLNGPTWTTGQLAGALSFDGTNDSVSVPHSTALSISNDITIAFWTKKNAEATLISRLVGKGNSSVRNYGIWEEAGTSKRLLFQQLTASGQGINLWTTNTLAVGTWYHVAAIVRGTNAYFYINGVLDNTGTRSISAPTTTDPVTLGYGGWNDYYPGVLDDVLIYNRALSAEEIASLAAKAYDSDGDGTADYLEDRNGNGVVDTGERSFTDAAASLTITSPTNNTVFTVSPTNIAITATALDNGSVTNVAIYNGTTLLGQAASSSCSLTWSNVSAGAYTLSAVANDNLGQSRTSNPVVITVNAMPTVNLASPPTSAYFLVSPTNILLQATASDTDGSITNVEFFNGTNSLGSDASNPYTLTWSNVLRGSYILTAKATDNRGATTTSATVTIGVNGGLDLGTTNAHVTFGNNTNLGLKFFTLETWIKKTGAGVPVTTSSGTGGMTAIPLITKGRSTESDGSNADMNYFLGIATNGNVIAADFEDWKSSDGGLNHAVLGVTTISNDVWYHAAVTYNGTNWQLFLNGALEADMAVNEIPRADSIQAAALGTAMSNSVPAGYFHGVLDEVRIWNYARTQAQIRDNMSLEFTNACGLVARWGLNEAQGTNVFNSTGTSISGTIANTGYNWTNSALLNLKGAALLVLNTSGSPTSAETAVSNRLQTIGYLVKTKDASSVASTDANGKTLVVIASTNSSAITNKFRNTATPVVLWRHDLYDDMWMVAGSNYGTTTGQTQIDVINPLHPLAAGLFGTVTVVSNSSTFAWGQPNSAAVQVGRIAGSTTNAAIFGYDKGATMPGLVAPARRVGLFLSDTTATSLNTNGWALFDAAVNWAAETPCPPVMDVVFVFGRSTSMAGQPLTDARNAAKFFSTNLTLNPDKAGMIAFASTATNLLSLTNHSATVLSVINSITNVYSGSCLDLGITKAQQELLSANHTTAALPLMIVFTDGMVSGSTNLSIRAAADAKKSGTRIITIGLTNSSGLDSDLLKIIASDACDYYSNPTQSDLTNILYSIVADLCRLTSNQPPSITLNLPSNGQSFANSPTNIVLHATAIDPDVGGTITNVVFYNGTSPIGMGAYIGTNGYQFIWEGVGNGTNSLSARAYDNLGASASSATANITVNGSPTIVLWTPTNSPSYTANATVPLSAYAVDSDGGSIAKVEFFQGTNTTAMFTNTTPSGNIFSNNWTGVTNGTYAVYARATDTNGGTAYSQVEVFTVNTNLTFPTVTIIKPSNNTLFKAGADITIDATATPSGQIKVVDFYEGTNYLGSDDVAPYTVKRCCWPSGEFVLAAKATHTNGTRAASSLVNITVADPDPTLSGGYWDPNFPVSAFYHLTTVFAMEVDSNGILYAGGNTFQFSGQGGLYDQVAKWEGGGWAGYMGDLGVAYALLSTGTNLYVAGSFSSTEFTNVYRRQGTNWVAVGNELNDTVHAVAEVGSDIYVGGAFTQAGTNDTSVKYIARLSNGVWKAVGNALTMPTNGTIRAIANIGDTIFIGGDFTAAGGNTNIHHIARLVGNTWTNVSSGVDNTVRALAVCDNDLFVGGDFTTAGGNTNAGCIAKWDGRNWSIIGRGVSGGTETFDGPAPSVRAIAVRGRDVFAGGVFQQARNAAEDITVNNIAKATWNPANQTYTWSALQDGVGNNPGGDKVTAVAIRESAVSSAYDVFVGGDFSVAGLVPSQSVARWAVGWTNNPAVPTVSITSPTNGTVLNAAEQITVNVSALAGGTNSITNVEVYASGTSQGTDETAPYSVAFYLSDPGFYSLFAKATDSASNVVFSAPVYIQLTNTSSPDIARDDFVTLLMNAPPTVLPVLANDIGAVRITNVAQVQMNSGMTTVGYGGTNIVYTPNADTYGTDIFSYSVTNASGVSDTAYVTVKIRIPPDVEITYPTDGLRTPYPLQTPLIVSGSTLDWDGTVSNVKLYTNNVQWGSQVTPTSSNTFSFSVSSLNVGFYRLTAVATDNHGYTNTSAPVDVNVYSTVVSAPPVVGILNPVETITNNHGFESIVYPVIREGLFTNFVGNAYDPDNTDDAYAVFLYRPDDPNNPFANITPSPTDGSGFHVGAITNASLGTLDFSAIPNGIYDLVLWVRGGGDETNAIVRMSLDTQLKVGQFTFSEQDLVIPVNGIPLTVIRTYNSFNPVEGDFGFNWTYAIDDMDVAIDEDRQIVPAITALDADDPLDKTGLDLNLRVGGGRNITLTLPDGRRTTFRFTYGQTTSGEICPGCVDAQWLAAPGVFAKLTTPSPATWNSIGDNSLIPLPGFGPVWNAGGLFTPMEGFDFPKFILTMQDGTKYEITRDLPGQTSPTYIYQDEAGYFGETFVTSYIQPHPNKPRLTKIEQRTGDTILIDGGAISHYPPGSTNATRTVWFERDTKNRIRAIRDPLEGEFGKPVVKYIYNEDTGNLIQVHKLVNRTAGSYLTNFYRYDLPNPNFRHYITEIDDARGIPAARNLYDDSGRLIGMIDAEGRTNSITHDLTGRIEQLVDRLGKTNIYAYDTRGNVTAITNALNQVTLYAYDDLNNKTNEVIGGVLTNSYVFDPNSFLLQSVIGGLVTNGFTYNPNGQVLTSTDGRGNVTTNQYDSLGNLTNFLTALSTNSNTYNALGLLTSTVDPLGNFTTNLYDNIGNLTNATVRDAANNLLSKTSYTYDSNGNRQSQSVQRTPASGSAINDVTSFVYDGQNRLIQTIDPAGKTNIIVYNNIGKQMQTIDKLGHTTSYFYDARGNPTNVTYADTTSEQYFYDAEARRTNTTDRAGRVTTSIYDSLGRLTTTVFPDNVSSNVTIYDAGGRVFQTIDARGATTGFKYDAAGRRVAVTNAVGIAGLQTVMTYAYDAVGNQTNMVDNLNRTNSHFYDALNRRTNATFHNGSKVITTFDAAGRRIAETDQATNTTRFAYDGLSRLTSVVNALSKTNFYNYDEVGNLTNQVDALNRSTKFEYDSLARRTKRILPGLQTEWFVYDAVGNPIRHTNFNQVVITNAYDSLNRLLSKSTTNGIALVSYLYSKTGLRTNMTDSSGTYGFVYDDRDRLRTNTTPQGTLFYTYDANGNLLTIKSSSSGGSDLVYQYDALNRLTNVVDARLTGLSVTNTSYSYDEVGNLKGYKYPTTNAVESLYQYDSLNRLTNLVWKTNGTTFSSYTYTLGPAGNRLTLTELLNGVNRTNIWAYDQVYRLTNEVVNASAAPTGSLGYTYDDVGNKLSRTGALEQLGNAGFAYTTNDWLTSNQYDANGNTVTNSSSQPYAYDYANRLTNFNNGTATFLYDGDGNRVKKTVGMTTTYYLVATVNPTGYPQVMEELTTVGGTPDRLYSYGHSLISLKAGGTNRFYGLDGHGSVRFLTDINGTITDTYVYDAFGSKIASTGSTVNNYRYTGEQWDGDLTFYYLRARYMNPNTGRFWTMDTFEGNQTDPLSLHKYLYGHANPVNRTDPSGKFDLTQQITGMSIYGKVAFLVVAPSLAVFYGHSHLAGSAPNETQEKKIEAAIALLRDPKLNGKYGIYADRAEQVIYRVRDMEHYGYTPLFGFRVVHVKTENFDWDTRLFAAILVHEMVHSGGQSAGWLTFYPKWRIRTFSEGDAYQVESDFFRDIGVTGKVDVVSEMLGGERVVIQTEAEEFRDEGVDNPAIVP